MPMVFAGANQAGTAAPYTRSQDVASMGLFLTLDQTEASRIARYTEAWRFYFGKHWGYSRESGEAPVTLNYYRKIIDKLAEFLVGKGFVIMTPEALEETTKPYLDEVWEYNQREQIAWDAAIMGGNTGDVFLMVTDEEPTELEKRINPFSQGRTKINLLGSEQVFPTWDPLKADKMLQCRIEHIFRPNKEVTTPGRDLDSEGNAVLVKRFTQVITPGQIVEQYHGEIPSIRGNVLGEIPIIHIKNLSIPREQYGMSDGADIIDINRELNEKSTDISDIINYHAAPITIILGGKAKNLQRGPNIIWSGLPFNASVFNLKLEGDLTASQNYWDKMKKTLHELSDVPEVVLGEKQAISNTSGVAMHLQYQPILGKTKRKRSNYEPGFQRINYFILRIGQVKGRLVLPYDLCASCGGKILEYEDPRVKEWVWDEAADDYVEKPKKVKRCFHIDKLNLSFMVPEKMRVKVWRQYGFGNEVTEMTIDQAREAAVSNVRSFWDYASVDIDDYRKYQENLARVRANNAQVLGNALEGNVLPEPLPPSARVRVLPNDEAVTYEEPEEVETVLPLYHPRTGELKRTVRKKQRLVPTGCRNPIYLNPYLTKVQFNEVLPKDEALIATLYQIYQTNRWVDEEWCQARIPDIAEDATNIQRRMRGNAPAAGKVDRRKTRGGVPDVTALADNLTAVPGATGNPVQFGTQE
jgi:Phage portal protein, SPP1 Gp6-like